MIEAIVCLLIVGWLGLVIFNLIFMFLCDKWEIYLD